MSSERLRKEQGTRPYPLGAAIVSNLPRVIQSQPELQGLSDYLHREGGSGLRLIGASDALSLKVEDTKSPWLEQTRVLAPPAIAQLMKVSPAFRLRLQALCQIIVPLGTNLPGDPRSDVGRGFSSHLFRGAIFMDPPATVDHRFEAYAINLAHELGHQAFFVYQSADPIIDGPLDAPVYSVIRMTDRPAIQSYHAVVASAYMAEFIGDWLAKDGSGKPNSEYLSRRLLENITHVEGGIRALSALRYTDIGRQILDEMQDLAAYLRGAHGV
jgi:HEXXH motif-containing protein